MAAILQPEVQLAQRLACNERPVRTKALKKLRKYIHARSQNPTGGFSGDELLKLWKGLFYCLWMQDKPLLQEELSHLISGLIHSFHDVGGQFLYLETSLQTLKREWTGIDRLRMDKFFQLVRFMFRQTFELLKRNNWDSSVVDRFLEVLTAELLHSSSEAPSGLQLHVLDLYMTELAAVGAAELTADQNLTFIEPFCKTAAKTKDRTLFAAICSNIFSTIIDQAPYAIDDLMKELKAAEASDSDSGQASEEEEEHNEQIKAKTTSKPVGKKGAQEQMNGGNSHDEDDDDELLHLVGSDTEPSGDDDMAPVLQFDYAALADKLFGLSSKSNIPSRNRQRLYKIIKVLQNLSKGIFPKVEYPEEVSTDEDDDMFGSRKRMKREGGLTQEGQKGSADAKKSKGKKKSSLLKQSNGSGEDVCEPTDSVANSDKKKKKRKKKKKKARRGGNTGVDVNVGKTEPEAMKETVSSVQVTEAAAPEGQPETQLLLEVKQQASVTVTEETGGPKPCPNRTHQPEPFSKKMEDASEFEEAVAQQVSVAQDGGAETVATTPAKRKKRGLKKTKGIAVESSLSATETSAVGDSTTAPQKPDDCPTPATSGETDEAPSAQGNIPPITSEVTTDVPLKKKRKKNKQEVKMDPNKEETDHTPEDQSLQSAPAADEHVPLKKRRKKNKQETMCEEEEVAKNPQPLEAEKPDVVVVTPAKKRRKSQATAQPNEQGTGGVEEELSSCGKPTKKKRKIPVVFEFEADEIEEAASNNGPAEEATAATITKLSSGADESPALLTTKKQKKKKKKKTSAGSASDFVSFQSKAKVPTPLFCRTKRRGGALLPSHEVCETPTSESKKVTFHLKNNKTAEFRKTDRSLLLSPEGSSRVPFDPQQKPKSGVLKSTPGTPSTSNKSPKVIRKKNLRTAQSRPTRRPTAADFF
ncbi:ribosomal RNA processing protein 1 homolog B [Aulostomus maculatus]